MRNTHLLFSNLIIQTIVMENKLNSTNKQEQNTQQCLASITTTAAIKQQKNVQQQQPFKKSHRRAHSMPMPSHRVNNKQIVQVTGENEKRQNLNSRKGICRPHILRNRHLRSTPLPNNNCKPIGSKTQSTKPDFDVIEVIEDEDEDLELPINEEEMMRFPGIDQNDEQHQHSKPHRVHRRFWQLNWKRVHFTGLPHWLQDNEFLHTGHRPQLGSFGSCFKSIFSLHTETGNIYTHMYGCVIFIGIFIWFLSRPADVVSWPDKLIFSTFFVGAILCMGLSFAFHTVQCHSENVGRLFSKLDYSGISLLIIGSFVPWLYYAFYCRALAMAIYIGMIVVLGIAAVIVSLWDKFAQPKFRPLRAGIFMAMGLSSVVPTIHLAITDGFKWMFEHASFHWLLLMGALYIFGATIYMVRFPERCFPGKCDLMCQSHQLFHLFVVFAAAVHYHGILELAMKRLEGGSCSEQLIERSGSDQAQVPWLDEKIRPF